MTQSKIAIFASGNGTNAEEIFKYFKHHDSIEVVILLTNNPAAFAITRAQLHKIPVRIFDKGMLAHSEIILTWLADYQVTHIVLAGFMWLIPDYLIRSFPQRIINIHPALLPNHGGKGMYGMKVHQSVKNAGDAETGITIHLVDERYDEGKIMFQFKCAVVNSDDPETIADKVHRLEYEYYPKAIESWIMDRKLND